MTSSSRKTQIADAVTEELVKAEASRMRSVYGVRRWLADGSVEYWTDLSYWSRDDSLQFLTTDRFAAQMIADLLGEHPDEEDEKGARIEVRVLKRTRSQ